MNKNRAIFLLSAMALALSGCGPDGPLGLLKTSADAGVDYDKSDDCPTSPAKLTGEIENGDYVINVRGGTPQIEETTLAGQRFSSVKLACFYNRGVKAGDPILPDINVHFAVATNVQTITPTVIKSCKSYNLSAPLAYKDTLGVHGRGLSAVVPLNRDSYERDWEMAFELTSAPSFAATTTIASSRITPVAFYPPDRIEVCDLEIRLRLNRGTRASLTENMAPVSADVAHVLDYADILNNDSVRSSRRSFGLAGTTPVDLLITDASYAQALQSYIEFKRSIMGRETKMVLVNTAEGRASIASIKQIIAENYRSTPPPSTTMLVGTYSQIPFGNNNRSDYGYQLIDGGDKVDVALGRIPARNVTELSAALSKIMAREQALRQGQFSSETILLTAGADGGLGCAQNMHEGKLEIEKTATSLKVSEAYRLNGASTNDIFNGYNANPNIIAYDGHGYAYGMSEVPLEVGDVSTKLKNQFFPIIFNIACDQNEQVDRGRNITDTFVFTPQVGPAGILASWGSAGGHDLFRNIFNVLSAYRSQLGTASHSGDELKVGHIIMAAKLRSYEDDNEMYNYFGDPASSLFPSTATPVQTPDLTKDSIKLALGKSVLETGATSAWVGIPIRFPVTTVSVCQGNIQQCRAAGAQWIDGRSQTQTAAAAIYGLSKTLSLGTSTEVLIRVESRGKTVERGISIKP